MKKCVLALAVFAGGCSSIGGNTPLSSRAPFPDGQEAMLLNSLRVGYECPGAQATAKNLDNCIGLKTGMSSTDLVLFADAGIALSDYYCGQFFRTVSQKAARRKFGADQANDIGGAAATVLGLAKAGSGVTGGVAAGFSFIESGFKNYDSAFLVSTEVNLIHQLVRTAQEQKALQIRNDKPSNVFRAVSAIQEHADICTFNGMKTLLDNSVQAKTNGIEAAITKLKQDGN